MLSLINSFKVFWALIWTLNMYFKHWFPYFLYVLTQCEILAWQQILMPHFFWLYGVSQFFRPGGLVHHSWREFLKYNLVFAVGYSFQNDKCYNLFSFTYLLLVFYISIFDIRRYNCAYLSCALVPSNEIYYVYWWMGRKK